VKNSKLILSAAIALGTILGGAASAADLAVKARPYPVAAAPVFSWTGCYVGVHGGAGVFHDQGFQPRGGVAEIIVDGNLADRHGVGGLAGGQIGCNYQTGMLVLGIEGEGFWSGMKITQDEFGFGRFSNTLVSSASIRNKWDYDVAGRIGVAFDRALVYGKAGWVAGAFDWNWATLGTFAGLSNQGSATLEGLLIGVGLEYAFFDNWTAKFEYDYLGFNAKNVRFTAICAFCTFNPTSTFTENVSADKHIFKVGLNYKFGWGKGPVVANY
jgi:outer membrane immunogenic protein